LGVFFYCFMKKNIKLLMKAGFNYLFK